MSNTYLFIVNPNGGPNKGHGNRILESVLPVFKDNGHSVEVKETQYAGHARDMVRSLDLSAYQGVCGIGGDGTVHELINGMSQQSELAPPLGVIPAGTGNSLMQHFDCLEPLEAAGRILLGEVRTVDLIRVSMSDKTVMACNIVGWGMITDINKTAEKIRWMGEKRYTIAALIHVLKRTVRRAKLEIDGNVYTDEYSFVLACNTRYTGKGMLMAPGARLSDGLVDIIVVRKASRYKLLLLFPKIFTGEHIHSDIAEVYQAASFSIHPEVPESILNIDGELTGSLPIQGEVVPRSVRIFGSSVV